MRMEVRAMSHSNCSGSLTLGPIAAMLSAIGTTICAIGSILAVIVVTQATTQAQPATQTETEAELETIRRKMQLQQQLEELRQQEQELKCKIQRLDNSAGPPRC